MPSSKRIQDIKTNLLHPATTSHFEVFIPKPEGIDDKVFRDNGININNLNLGKLHLLCCEASLPGSNFATLELTNDYTGVTERHAYRRVYDDRIDLTFYVDAEETLPIRFFEIWMKSIAREMVAEGEGKPSSRANNYFYRFNYPDNYICDQGLKITKFERSSIGSVKGKRASTLTYEFIRAFPISISSMPVAYDSSSLLKCTVSMTYIRYIVDNLPDPPPQEENKASTPIEQAAVNSNPVTPVGTANPLNNVTSEQRVRELEQSFGKDPRTIPFNTRGLGESTNRRTGGGGLPPDVG